MRIGSGMRIVLIAFLMSALISISAGVTFGHHPYTVGAGGEEDFEIEFEDQGMHKEGSGGDMMGEKLEEKMMKEGMTGEMMDFEIPGFCKGKMECMRKCMESKENMEKCMEHGKKIGMEGMKGPMRFGMNGMKEMKPMAMGEIGEKGMGDMGMGSYHGPDYSMMHPGDMFAVGMMGNMMEIEDPMKYLQYCDDVPNMVEILFSDMKAKGAFERKCERIEEELKMCKEMHHKDGCEKWMEHMEERCKASKEEIIKHCIAGFAGFGGDVSHGRTSGGLGLVDCERQWEEHYKGVEHICSGGQNCNKDEFIVRCENERKLVCEGQFIISDAEVESCAIANCGDKSGEELERCKHEEIEDCREDLRDRAEDEIERCIGEHCDDIWENQEKVCEGNREVCDKDEFMEECREKVEDLEEWQDEESEEVCEKEAERIDAEMERNCGMMDEEIKRCEEMSKNRCDFIEEALTHCKEFDEDDGKIKEMMMKKGEIICKMHGSDSGLFRAMMMRGMKDEHRFAIAEGAEAAFETEEELEEVEMAKGGLLKKIFRFFGLFREDVQKELEELRQSLMRLDNSINNLRAITSEMEDGEQKQRLMEEIEKLEREKQLILGKLGESEVEIEEEATGGFVKVVGNFFKS